MKRETATLLAAAALGLIVFYAVFSPTQVLGHCDTLGGPVIKAAQKALETGNINLVLIWVQKQDEAEVKKMFGKTLAVRKLDPAAKEIADMYFFETLVRLHRAGEGAPYTGLKPAGVDLGPVIPATDKAIEDGSVNGLLKLLVDTVQTKVQDHFQELMTRRKFNENDVDSGRRYVKSYVLFTHYVEKIYESSLKPAEGHSEGGTEEVHK